jgi:hypothetical protein
MPFGISLEEGALPFLSAFDGFARLSFGRIRNVAGVALIHVEHAERAGPIRIGVLDGQEMLFCFAEQEKGRNQNGLSVSGLGSLFVKQALDLVVWDRYDDLALSILEFHRLFLFVENEVTFYRFDAFFLTFHLRGHVLYFVELHFRRTRSCRKNE